jgi:hypothetical protein
VAEFRARSRAGQSPPFSPRRRMDDPDARGAITRPLDPTPRRSPIVVNWP